MKDKKLWDFHQDENRMHLKASYPRQDMIFQHIGKYLKKGVSILEIGFGDGYLLNELSNHGYLTIGQDLSEKNIEITKKQWKNDKIKFVLGDDSGKFQFDDGSLDGFVASEVLEHMDNESLCACVSEIRRLLKKEGYAFFTFPARENLKNNECLCPNCSEVFHKWGHKQYWDEKKVREVFQDFELVVLKEFVSRSKSDSLLENMIGYLKYFGSYILNMNKSYFVIAKKV